MIFLLLVYVLHVRFRGSKYDTCQSHVSSRVIDHTGCSVGRRVT